MKASLADSAARAARSLALALVICATGSASLAPAQQASRPFEALHRERVAEVARLGRSPSAIIPLLEIWRMWNDVPPAMTVAALERFAADRRLSPAVRQYAAQLRARAHTRLGDPDASRRAFDALGYIRTFRVAGPFDNEGKAGFDRVEGPERARMEAVDRGAQWEGRERAVGWRDFPDVVQYGYVSFDAIYRPDTNVCAYAETFVTSDRAQPLSLWVGAGGAVRAWWNGEEVLSDSRYRQPDPDRHVVMVGAQQGLNRLLLKVCVASSTWGFFARLGDPSGAPATGLTFAVDGDAALVRAGHAGVRLSGAPVRIPGAPSPGPEAPLAALEAALAARPTAETQRNLAELLAYTGADDPAEMRARQLAALAAEGSRDPETAVFAAQLASERGEAMRLLALPQGSGQSHPAVLLARARLTSTGPSPEEALPILDRIPESAPEWMDGQALRAELLDELSLSETASAVIDRAAQRAPGTARWLSLRVARASAVDRRDLAIQLRGEIVPLRWDDLGNRRVLLGDALERGDRDTVLVHLDVIRRLGIDHASTYVTAAEVFDALGEEAEMLGAYRAGIELAPEEASLRAAYGRALLRAGQRDAAQTALREALALRPQDAETRELLETIQPEEPRPDERYAASEQEILARVREESGYPARVLQNLTVNTVFESGLGSSFHQVAAQIVDADGARAWRSYPIQFDPDSQRVVVRAARVYRGGQRLEAMQTYEQQLAEPWYRIYYDTRQLVVVFPDLEPEDVVEIRYRIDDVAARNQFHDYYGDLHYLQGQLPVARLDYVLITPSSRQFYFNEPRPFTGESSARLVHEQSTEGDRRIDHFQATEVPAIRPEDRMPGMTEVAPYLHVSTYRTWEDVGRWYWGLIHDQLYADEHLRGVVRELMQGTTDTPTRVRRIYDWVIRNTRYVGLEFGIHGFLPYRVPQIVQRGFGDCKDKASLIYTMLREAGIDARIVLVRTRRNGAINDLPASLAVFDHAIAYVPELDLFLDGTAEYSGPAELPQMDQGVTVLVVGPDGAEIRRTPVMPATANRRSRTITIDLETDGDGRVSVEEEVVGTEAPGYRVTYQAEGTRAERLERALRSLFPGIELAEQQIDGLTSYGDPIRIRYTASVPQLATVDADGLRVRPSVLDELSSTLARMPSRRQPLDLQSTSTYAEERRIRVPQGMRVLALPGGGEAESPFGRLTLRFEERGREVIARTELTVERDVIAPGDYEAFRSWLGRVDVLLRQRIALGGRQ